MYVCGKVYKEIGYISPFITFYLLLTDLQARVRKYTRWRRKRAGRGGGVVISRGWVNIVSKTACLKSK